MNFAATLAYGSRFFLKMALSLWYKDHGNSGGGVLIKGLKECMSSGLTTGPQFFFLHAFPTKQSSILLFPKAYVKTSQGQFGICNLRLFVDRPQLENETLIE